MENFNSENIDELLEIRQIRQYFPRQNFAPYGSLQYIFTTMIGFVTWPLLKMIVQKVGQLSDKANHSCENACKLLHIIQVKGSPWPYLISKILVAYS